MLGEKKAESTVREILGGVGGASNHLVTIEPHKRRNLPFTFNSTLRASRQAAGLEDDTDSEEEFDGTARLNEKGEPAFGEPIPTGSATAGGRAVITEIGGDSMKDEDGAEEVVQQSGRKMAGDKPVGKREMSDLVYKWAKIDIINPNISGFYSSDVPAGKRAKARAVRAQKRGVALKRSTFIPMVKK